METLVCVMIRIAKLRADGNPEAEPLPEQVQALSDEVISKDLLPLLADNLFRLDFEVVALRDSRRIESFLTHARQAKKDVTGLFSGLLRYRPHQYASQHTGYPVVDY